MRSPLLLVAAIAVTGGSIGVFACSERRHQPQVAQHELRAMDVSMPSRSASVSAAPVAPPPAPPVAPFALSKMDTEPPERAAAPIADTASRIAYSYSYRFRVPATALALLQERHLQLCLSLGEMRCRIVSMRRSEPRPQAATAEHNQQAPQPDEPAAALELQVASPLAERFGRQLTSSTGDAGGETLDRQIGAEDVSRQMVDSEARIRTRETLIRRLSILLQTRSGNIQQAVEAERAINQAQEELDAARTWLAEMRDRVSMSQIAIAYESAGTAATSHLDRNPLAVSIDRIGALTVQSLAALLLVAGLLIPWGAVILLIVLAARWHRKRALAVSQPLQ
jgi:hypothetical protein